MLKGPAAAVCALLCLSSPVRAQDAQATADAGTISRTEMFPDPVSDLEEEVESRAPSAPPRQLPSPVTAPTRTSGRSVTRADAGSPDVRAVALLELVPPVLQQSKMVMLHDTAVFAVRAGAEPAQLEQRVDAIQHALEGAAVNATADSVRVEERDGISIIFVDDIPVVQLTPQDAVLAGDTSLPLHAARISARIKEAIRKEQKRSAIARTVFSLSLVVFFGLIALFLMRKAMQLSARGRDYLLTNHDAALALRLKSVDLVGPAAMRSGLLVGLSVGRWVALLGILYAWLLVSLSLFRSTRAYTDRLTGFVFGPVSDLVSRVATSLPLLAVALLGILAVALLVRFVGLFFASVERGQTRLGWLPYDLTAPASLLLRAGIILATLIFGAPIITGRADGVFTRSGLLLLGSIGLAATPLLASIVIGIMVVFWRRIRVGDFAEMGGRSGKVMGVDLLSVRLQDRHGGQVQVPHLLAIFHPMRTMGRLPTFSAEVRVAATDRTRDLCSLLLMALAKHFESPEVEIIAFSLDDVVLRVRVTAAMAQASVELHQVLTTTLQSNDFRLLAASLDAG